jgi:NAD(P)-dependent dehydrogenase (short-subunit alcohol dehydrogenase family)
VTDSNDELRPRPGLHVFVTAGASGIGRDIAEGFLRHDAKVLVCDVDEAALADFAAANPNAHTMRADVGEQADIDGVFDALEDWLGGLDVLVNNAGIAGPTANVEDMEPDDWRRTVDVNLNGQFYCLRRAVPLLKQSDHASIIALSSAAGRLGMAQRLPYAATKWAIVGMTESLALELGDFGIRVNCIQPGIVEGPRIDRVISARAGAAGVSFEEECGRTLQKVAMGKMVTNRDIANTALFLCTPAGANISGQALSVCAGVIAL